MRLLVRYLAPRVHWIILFLALGAAINFAIAWASALWSDRAHNIERGVSVLFSNNPSLEWPGDVTRAADKAWLHAAGKSAEQFFVSHRQSFGLDRRAFHEYSSGDNLNWWDGYREMPDAVQTLAGWPLPCLEADQWLTLANSTASPPATAPTPPASPPGPFAPTATYRFEHALVVTVNDRLVPIGLAQRPLPKLVLWRGFMLNTLVFAAMLLVLVASPRLVRGFLRARRALCPTCAYPIGTSPVCTECGKAVPRGVDHGPLVTRRRLGVALMCLILGAASSTLTAWAFALWSPIFVKHASPKQFEGVEWWTSVPSQSGPVDREVGPGIDVHVFTANVWTCHLIRSGWPFKAWAYAIDNWDNGENRYELVHHGHRMPTWMTRSDWDRQCLPQRPLWPGIIGNTIAQGAMWWLAIAGATALRRSKSHSNVANPS